MLCDLEVEVTSLLSNCSPGVLHLSTVDVQDGGVYTCHSPEGKKRIVYLNVQKPPQVYASHLGSWTRLAVIYAKIGQSARVMCRGEAFPEPDVRWFHNGLMYKDTNFHSQGNFDGLLKRD